MAVMTNGHPTTVAFQDDSALTFEVKSFTPFGLEKAEIDITTMSNSTYRTKVAGNLIDVTQASMTIAYDPATLTEMVTMIGDNQTITITFPDNQTWTVWGFIASFTPGESAPDEQPTAEVVLVATNRNDSGVETAPALA